MDSIICYTFVSPSVPDSGIKLPLFLSTYMSFGSVSFEDKTLAEFIYLVFTPGSRDSLLVGAPDSWSKSCEFESRQERRGEFSSQELTLFADAYSVSVHPHPPHPLLPQWHVKDPGHSAKSANDRLHVYMHKPLTQRGRSGLTMPLSRHSEET